MWFCCYVTRVPTVGLMNYAGISVATGNTEDGIPMFAVAASLTGYAAPISGMSPVTRLFRDKPAWISELGRWDDKRPYFAVTWRYRLRDSEVGNQPERRLCGLTKEDRIPSVRWDQFV